MIKNPASKLQLTPDGPFAFLLHVPPWLGPEDELVQRQGLDGYRLLQELNAAAGNSAFRGLIIFNDEALAEEADQADQADYWWGATG